MNYHGNPGQYHAVGRQAGMVSRGHVMEELVEITKKCGLKMLVKNQRV